MSDLLNLKRWQRVEYEAGPAKISMELRRMKRREARPLLGALSSVFHGVEDAQMSDLGQAAKLDIMSKAFDAVPPEKLEEWFSKCVRHVEGLAIDDVPVTTGAELLEDADDNLIIFVLLKLMELARLAPEQAKPSASRSTLLAERATSGDSPAESTECEAGPMPSTVTPIRSVN